MKNAVSNKLPVSSIGHYFLIRIPSCAFSANQAGVDFNVFYHFVTPALSVGVDQSDSKVSLT